MRVLAGGRSLTIEGNTLDPMLYLLRIGQRVMGLKGLAVGDLAQTREYVRVTAGSIAGAEIGVEVDDLTIPGRPDRSGPATTGPGTGKAPAAGVFPRRRFRHR